MLTARRTVEYGAAYFGFDYDQKIYHWIESNYRVVGQFGRYRRDEAAPFLRLPWLPCSTRKSQLVMEIESVNRRESINDGSRLERRFELR